MNTETALLIDRLCADVPPVRRIWSPNARACLWLPTTVIYSITLISLVGSFRPGVLDQLIAHPRMLLESALGVLAGLVATWAAFESMVPGIRWTTRKQILILLPTFLFCMLTFYGIYSPVVAPTWSGWRPGCEIEILAYGTLPVLTCFVLAMRGAPTNSGWTGFLVGIAAFSPAMVGINLACAYDPIHIVFFHLLPVGILSLSCSCFGKSFFRL